MTEFTNNYLYNKGTQFVNANALYRNELNMWNLV